MHADSFAPVPERADEPRRLIGVKEAARVLGDITTRHVYNLITAGELQSVHIGRRRMIVVASLDGYVERLRTAAAA